MSYSLMLMLEQQANNTYDQAIDDGVCSFTLKQSYRLPITDTYNVYDYYYDLLDI